MDEIDAMRERLRAAEQRAAKLAQASAALRETLESVRTADDLEALLGHTLKAIADQLGVGSASAWVFDPDLVAHLMWTIEDGRIVRGAESSHANANRPSLPNAWHHQWLRGMDTPAPNVLPVVDHPGMTPEQRAFLLGRGVRALISVPMVLRAQLVGSFTLHLRSDTHPLGEDLELIQALANQASLAFHLTRLAEETRAVAVAHERQRVADERAAQLARANAALRTTLARLNTADDLDELLGETLDLLAQHMNARSSAVYVADPERTLHCLWVLAGGARARGQRPVPARWLRDDAVDETPRVVVSDDRDDELGVTITVDVPILLGTELVGLYTFGLASGRPSVDDLELLQALANQAAIAIKLARLAKEARAAVVVQEEERAARQRAEELARFAATSRRTLDRLASTRDLDAFLGDVLRVAVEHLRAVGCSVWRAPADGTPRLEALLDDGELRTSDIEGGLVNPDAFLDVLRAGAIHFVGADEIARRPEYAERAAQGIRTIAIVPMRLDQELRGALVLRFGEDRTLSPDETELAHTFASQAVLAMELTRLSQRARTAAIGDERNRLAREIHDTIAQGLAAIIRQLDTAVTTPATAAEHVALAAAIARESLVEARRSIRALRPPALEGRTLEGALRELVHRLARMSACPIRAAVSGPRTGLPSDVEDELYRIAHEALTNAIKHASARTIEVELAYDPSSVRVGVRDDGVGFDAAAPRGGIGMSSMRERAARIGAVVTVATEPGTGTEVLVYWAAP